MPLCVSARAGLVLGRTWSDGDAFSSPGVWWTFSTRTTIGERASLGYLVGTTRFHEAPTVSRFFTGGMTYCTMIVLRWVGISGTVNDVWSLQ